MGCLRMLLCLLMLFPALSDAEEKLDDKNEFLLSKHKAGHVEIGMTIDALYAKYGRESTKLVDLYLEGSFSPALEVYLEGGEGDKKGKAALVVEIGWRKDWIARRINVYDKRFKTDKDVGVGSTLGDIRKSYKVDWIKPGEGAFCARVEEIKVSFALDIIEIPHEWYETREQDMVPDTTRVVSVLMN